MKISTGRIARHTPYIFTLFLVLHVGAQQEVFSGKAQVSNEQVNTAIIPVEKLENDFYDWHQRHEEVVELVRRKQVDLIFIGDSITHMFGGRPKSEIARGKEIWDQYYGHRNAINMGFGWDRTQNVLWRLENGELERITPKVAVILIGTNNRTGTNNARQNTPAEIAEGIETICKAIHKKVPKCKILLLGVLPRSPEHFVEPIQEINKLLSRLNKEDYISVLDMYDQFADKDGLPRKELMHDTVHPNEAGYRVWAETMEPVLSKLLKKRAVKPNKQDADNGK